MLVRKRHGLIRIGILRKPKRELTRVCSRRTAGRNVGSRCHRQCCCCDKVVASHANGGRRLNPIVLPLSTTTQESLLVVSVRCQHSPVGICDILWSVGLFSRYRHEGLANRGDLSVTVRHSLTHVRRREWCRRAGRMTPLRLDPLAGAPPALMMRLVWWSRRSPLMNVSRPCCNVSRPERGSFPFQACGDPLRPWCSPTWPTMSRDRLCS